MAASDMEHTFQVGNRWTGLRESGKEKLKTTKKAINFFIYPKMF